MGKVGRIVRALAIPDLPQDVRADYVIAAATQVQKQARWLFVALLLTCPLAIFVTPESSGWFVRWVLPLGMSIYCLSGLLTLFKGTAFEGKPWRAEKFIVESWFSSLIGAMIIQSVNTGILLAGFPPEFNLVIKAAIIVVILVVQSPASHTLFAFFRHRPRSEPAAASEPGKEAAQ